MSLQFPKGLEDQIQAQSNGHPFKRCPVCDLQQVPNSAKACNECLRLLSMKMAVPKDPRSGVEDTTFTPSGSYPSDDHSGYKDTIPSTKFPKDKERM
jgi:hypothetical protein